MESSRTWKDERENTGYVLIADTNARIFRLRFWGLWDESLGRSFEKAALEGFSLIPDDRSWSVLADISAYPPQRPAVQASHAKCMGVAKGKIHRAANLVAGHLSQMQIRRLSEESGLPSYAFFTKEAEAVRWLQMTGDAEADRLATK